MNLDLATQHIRNCRARMDAAYGRVVFDEWVIISLSKGRAGILFYEGPRADSFSKQLAVDASPLGQDMEGRHYEAGDFEFTMAAEGSCFDAAVKLGGQAYLLCNNVALSMADVRSAPAWREAQKPFVVMTEKFRADPLV